MKVVLVAMGFENLLEKLALGHSFKNKLALLNRCLFLHGGLPTSSRWTGELWDEAFHNDRDEIRFAYMHISEEEIGKSTGLLMRRGNEGPTCFSSQCPAIYLTHRGAGRKS